MTDPHDGAIRVSDDGSGTRTAADPPQIIAVAGHDRRLAIVGGACIGVSILGAVAELLGLLPSTVATVVVLVAAGVALRLALVVLGRTSSSGTRSRVARAISTVGLVISSATLILVLPSLTSEAGLGTFLSDLLAHAWTLGVLTVAASPVRTLSWRVFAAMGLTGFLALSLLAGLLGRPVVDALGSDSVLAIAVWVPITEMICLALPVLLILRSALRRSGSRPSAIDLLLVGAWAGAGFALYEDTQFGRGGPDWSAAPPFSLLFPTLDGFHVEHASGVIAGHAVWIGLVGLALGFGLLYRHRFPHAWWVIPVALVVVFAEHAAINTISALGGEVPLAVRLLLVLTVNGWLSSMLLVAGLVTVLWIECRALGEIGRPTEWYPLRPTTASSRSQRLAVAQSPRDVVATESSVAAGTEATS